MAKKKILIVDSQLCLGGVGIAAVNMIENLKNDFEIDLLLEKPGGELVNRLPKSINIHYVDPKLTFYNMPRHVFKKVHPGFWNYVKKIFIGVLKRIGIYRIINKKQILKSKQFLGDYDVIVNNDMDAEFYGLCHYYTMLKANAKKRFLFIHGDFLKNNYHKNYFLIHYMQYDKIISVSDSLNKQMEQVFPEYKNKFESLLNFQDTNFIKSMAEETKVTFEKDVINIVSASRLTEVKAYMRTLKVLAKLVSEGVKNFCWHILGDGEQREEIEKYIKTNNLQDNVVLYGVKDNPYPYFKSADLVMLNSYHESYGLVLIEALILKTPVFTTNTLSATELIDEKYGWVVDNDENGIYEGLKKVLSDKTLIKNKKNNLKNYEYDNEGIKEKFKELIK